MNFIQWICEHWKMFWKQLLEGDSQEEHSESHAIALEENMDEREKINLEKRTIPTKLYSLEQEISVFMSDFPEEFKSFQDRIEILRRDYEDSLEKIENELHFEINPEQDGLILGRVVKLEKDIDRFLQREVRFNIISNQLQKLVVKLNILYNVSIFHNATTEKESINRQLQNALSVEARIVCDFKSCDYILLDAQLKERIVNLLSYVDYHILKISLRSSETPIQEVLSKLAIFAEFEGFQGESAFVAFLKDELSDLMELIPYIQEEEFQNSMQKEAKKLVILLTYSAENAGLLTDTSVWKQFFHFEFTLLNFLRENGVDKEKAKTKLLERMEISIEAEDVLNLPRTNAFLTLTSLYGVTHNTKVLLLLKLLKRVSKEVSYKEIYFIALLFDVFRVLKDNANMLVHYLEKYAEKYPYSQEELAQKKQAVLRSSKKDYVVAFKLDENRKEIMQTLDSLELDYKLEGDIVLLNAFYFNGMNHVLTSLQTGSK